MTIYVLEAVGHTIGEQFSFGVHVNGAADSTTEAAAAWHTALGLLWNGVSTPDDSIKQLVSIGVGIDDSFAAQLDPTTGKQVDKVVTSETLAGTAVGEQLPHECSIAVSLRTALATRAGRGRFYLPPYDTTTVESGRLDVDPRDQTAAAAQGMIQSLNGDSFQVVIYHHFTLDSTPVTRLDVGNVFDSQRRRRNKLVEVRTSLAV